MTNSEVNSSQVECLKLSFVDLANVKENLSEFTCSLFFKIFTLIGKGNECRAV